MTSRKSTPVDRDGFSYPGSMTSGSMTLGSSAWGALRPGSRAERLHQGRPSINRRKHRLSHRPEDEGKGNDARQHQVNQTDGGERGRDSRSPSVTDRHDSMHSEYVAIDDEERQQQLEAVTTTKNIGENEATFCVEQMTVKQVVVSSVYVEPDTRGPAPASCHQSLHLLDQWLPVTVIRYDSSREPVSIKGSSSREACSSAPRKETELGLRGERRYTQERIKDREPQSPIHESSLAKTIIKPKDSGRRFSRSTDSFSSSADWNSSSDVSRSNSSSDCLSDRFGISDPRERKATGQQFRSSSATKIVSNCYREETHTFYSPISSNSSSSSSTTAGVATQSEPRSSHGDQNHYGESSSNFRIGTKSMHGDNARDMHRSNHSNAVKQRSEEKTKPAMAEKEFLGKVGDLQRELDNQRLTWQPEIDRSLDGTMATDDLGQTNSSLMTSFEAASSSYVDTSTPVAMFKANVDVREFPPDAISVHFDRYTNEVTVQAKGCCCCEGEEKQEEEESKRKTLAARRIALPRYADDTQLTARVNSEGVLRIEVPLLFYFPEESKTSEAFFISESK